MNKLDTLMLLLTDGVVAAVIYAVRKKFNPSKQEEASSSEPTEQAEIKFVKSCQILDDLNLKRQELFNVEQSLTSLDIAHPQNLVGIKITVPNAKGQNYEIPILVGKDDKYTKLIKEILATKRTDVRCDYQELIQHLNGDKSEIAISDDKYTIKHHNDSNKN